jgi:hypothetical protein
MYRQVYRTVCHFCRQWIIIAPFNHLGYFHSRDLASPLVFCACGKRNPAWWKSEGTHGWHGSLNWYLWLLIFAGEGNWGKLVASDTGGPVMWLYSLWPSHASDVLQWFKPHCLYGSKGQFEPKWFKLGVPLEMARFKLRPCWCCIVAFWLSWLTR